MCLLGLYIYCSKQKLGVTAIYTVASRILRPKSQRLLNCESTVLLLQELLRLSGCVSMWSCFI